MTLRQAPADPPMLKKFFSVQECARCYATFWPSQGVEMSHCFVCNGCIKHLDKVNELQLIVDDFAEMPHPNQPIRSPHLKPQMKRIDLSDSLARKIKKSKQAG